MKVQRILLFILMALSPAPGTAEPVTQDFLEQPGMVWVSADLPIAVKSGKLIAMVPWVRFTDGALESGFMVGRPFYYDAKCEELFTCPKVTANGVYEAGTYSLPDSGRLQSDAEPVNLWQFDRYPAYVAASAFLTGGVAQLTREGDTLVQSRSEGARVYHAIPVSEANDALTMISSLEVSVLQTYECTSRALYDLRRKSVSEYSDEDMAMLAFLRVMRKVQELDVASRVMLPDAITFGETPPSPELRAKARTLENTLFLLRYSVFWPANEMAKANGSSVRPYASIDPKTRQNLDQMQSQVLTSDQNPDAIKNQITKYEPDFELAATFAARYIRATKVDRATYQDTICDR